MYSYNYYNKLLKHELLDKEATYALIRQYQSTSCNREKTRVVDTLTKHNFKYIYKLALRFCNTHSNTELDDCVQTASMAIRKAIEKFDLTRNFSFSTYLTWWLKSYLQRAWQKNHRTLYVPTHIQELHRSIKRVIKDYEIKHGVKPSILYIAEELEITREKVINTLSAMRSTSSLDVNINNSDGQPTLLLDLIQDDKVVGPNEVIESVNLNETLNELLNILSDKQRTVLELRFGLYTNKPLSLAKVGEKLGCSRENIRLIERHALHALRTHRNINDLEELYLS